MFDGIETPGADLRTQNVPFLAGEPLGDLMGQDCQIHCRLPDLEIPLGLNGSLTMFASLYCNAVWRRIAETSIFCALRVAIDRSADLMGK